MRLSSGAPVSPYAVDVGFVAATIGTVAILALIFFLLGRKYPVSRLGIRTEPAPQTDTIKASQVERDNPGLVQDDVRQMLAAQNALREKRGAPAMTVEDLRTAVAEDDRNRSRGRGPFSME